MVMLSTLRRYLPSAPGTSRRRFDEIAEQIRAVREEARLAHDRLAETVAPLTRMSEHLPLLRRELDDFVQSLSVTLRQASERIRELDERIDALLEHSRMQADAIGALQSTMLANEEAQARRSSLPVPMRESTALAALHGGRDVATHLDELRSTTDRLAEASMRSQELLAELAGRPQPQREAAPRMALLLVAGSMALAAAAVVLAVVALLR